MIGLDTTVLLTSRDVIKPSLQAGPNSSYLKMLEVDKDGPKSQTFRGRDAVGDREESKAQ